MSEKDAYAIAQLIQGACTHISISELYGGTRLHALSDLNEDICRGIQQVVFLGSDKENTPPIYSRKGTYLTRSRKALLCLEGSSWELRSILARCGSHLHSLEIADIGLTVLELGDLYGLKTLYLHDNHALTSIHGLTHRVALATLRISNCEQLTELNLFGCKSLKQLIGIEGLTRLTDLNLGGCYTLEELPPLDSLTHMTSLELRECSRLTLLPSLDKMTQLTHLNLSQCISLTQLPSLDNLAQLTHLNLSGCSSLTQLPSLDTLTQLTDLDLNECSSLTLLPNLDKLTQLTDLDLRECSSLTLLPSLDHLSHLTALDLHGCSSLTQLPSLDKLSQLTNLTLHNCSSLTHLPSLDKLTQLTVLDLSECSNLTQLPSLDTTAQLTRLELGECSSLTQLPCLDKLTQLTYLNLTRCSSLIQLPSLDQLTHLTGLYLGGCSSLTQLPSLDQLPQLTTLYLWGCNSLTQIPRLDKLTQLIDLELSGCSTLTRLPNSIRSMKKLKKLFLCDLKLEALPDWLPEIAEKYTTRRFDWGLGKQKANVNLSGTTVEGVDMSIFEQPYEMVVEWFEKRKQGLTRQLNEIKVVFLGDGEAGKSHTIARLMNDGGEPDKAIFDGQSTPGIVIRNKDYDLDGRKIQVHYWDFGGQEIMHSMHRIFLTNRTMYVVLINSRDDTQSDRAHYWLQNIQSFAPDAPVLLVLNKIDQNPKASVDERTLRAKYKGLTEVVRLSALEFSQELFNREFTDVLLKQIRKCDCLDAQWPQSWIRVKEFLEGMDNHYIMGDDYLDLCRDAGVDANQKDLLNWFNDLGVSFCCCEDEDYALKDYVVLRPDWITNGLYIMLFNECEGASNGRLPHRSIDSLLRSAHTMPDIRCTLPGARYRTNADIQFVLGVMRKFQLSLDAGDGTEFIPMLCQQDSTVDIHYYEKDADTLEFRIKFEYLPDNLLHRLMVERHTELDMTNVWRKGARFQLPGTGLSAVVVIDGNVLKLFIRHTDSMHRPNTYLTMLKANVDRIWRKMGLQEPNYQLVYKLDNKFGTFDYEELRQAREYGETAIFSKVWKHRLLIENILNQSAPEGLDDEQKLLQSVLKACEQIQREPECRGSKEDNRNRRMRDALENRGYEVFDQRQMGASSTRKDAGELDLMLYRKERDEKKPWSIIEALRVADGAKRDWNSHLGKLLDNYNPHGVPFLFLVTYADCEKEQFDKIWNGYQSHIQQHSAGKFAYDDGSFRKLTDDQDGYFIQSAISRYRCGGYIPTVYHIFVQMDLP